MNDRTFTDIAKKMGREIEAKQRPTVCVQGLGFVGAAMAIAVANARDDTGEPCFNVIGIDLPNAEGLSKLEAINNGRFPVRHNDPDLESALRQAHASGNLIATSDATAYGLASVVVVDVPLDVAWGEAGPSLRFDDFRAAIRGVGNAIEPGCLVIVETTVPPGTCEKVVAPELASALEARGLPKDCFLLAHSYERVMPGREYFQSIVNFWRVYAGYTTEAGDACETFLSKVINVDDYPLTRLESTTASETGKVLENAYRATTIAFMEEWSQLAHAVDIDLFDVVSAIRTRPTHSNMRTPGFGVGGYCLTKDPLLASLATKELFGVNDIKFPLCEMAVEINSSMPLVSLERVQRMLGGDMRDKSLFLLGVSYRPDIGDTRYSPSQLFVRDARARGAKVTCYDPFVEYWPELDEHLPSALPAPGQADAIVFAVAHEPFQSLDVSDWLNGATPIIFDANNVLGKRQRDAFRAAGCQVASIGRGDEL